MRVAVLGAAGKVGRLVVEGLVAEGHQVVGLVRTDEQAALISGLGASAVQGDLEGDLSEVLVGAEAAVFAAGASLGGDPERIDRDACIAAQRAAEGAGVTRWVQVSSLMADRPQEGPPFLFGFLSAKRAIEVVDREGLQELASCDGCNRNPRETMSRWELRFAR
jgi:uncharacterized protein YbjT (DUF2867 family)